MAILVLCSSFLFVNAVAAAGKQGDAGQNTIAPSSSTETAMTASECRDRIARLEQELVVLRELIARLQTKTGAPAERGTDLGIVY